MGAVFSSVCATDCCKLLVARRASLPAKAGTCSFPAPFPACLLCSWSGREAVQKNQRGFPRDCLQSASSAVTCITQPKCLTSAPGRAGYERSPISVPLADVNVTRCNQGKTQSRICRNAGESRLLGATRIIK